MVTAGLLPPTSLMTSAPSVRYVLLMLVAKPSLILIALVSVMDKSMVITYPLELLERPPVS